MTSLRRIGAIAAIGTLAAASALLTGLAAANADELSDLRANNEVLQQRLDQLAQVGLRHPNLPPGTASIAGSFPRSFLIPGTDTSIEIGGFVDLDASYFITAGGNNSNAAVPPVTGAPIASGLPLPGTAAASRQYGWFRMQASNSRFFVETRTPTPYGQALTHLEFDFFGCTAGAYCNDLNTSTNPDTPRLRLAYGTLGGFLAGQTWVPGNDLQASPEIFDFGGDVGGWGWARAPQIGYKTPVPWLYGGTAGIYLVQPYTQIATPEGAFSDESSSSLPSSLVSNPGKTPLPDAALVLNWEQPWGHFQLHGAVRELDMNDGSFLQRSFIGYGGGFSGNVHPGWLGWTKDNLGFQAYAGDGLGHWNNPPGSGANTLWQGLATNYGGPGLYGFKGGPTSALAAAAIRATTVFSWGGEVNYQHWWTGNLRSSFTFGIGHQDLPIALLGFKDFYNKEIETAHVNLVWSPVPFINTGFEYIYDHRLTANNVRGSDGHILTYHFQVKF
ncbi:MAG TPA: hypothetical protein VND95_13185 [Stellaceae bacterium]|nr:hypothetical protein [Stellaceae bacterium]